MQSRVLVVDDDPSSCEFLVEALSLRGFAITSLATVEAAMATFDVGGEYDTVVADLGRHPTSSLDFVHRMLEREPDLPVVAVTAFGNIDSGVEAVRHGAYDFLTKPFDIEVAALVLERATRHRTLRTELRRLRRSTGTGADFEELVGKSPPMQRVYETVELVTNLDSPVWITGESGTGKQLVARALHRRSTRALAPFVALNCASVPDATLDAELFGQEPLGGAGSRGARAGIVGCAARAQGGTLFLDEIGRMNLESQAKLLTMLDRRSYRRAGSDEECAFDARLVVASHRDLESLVARGRFRQDLLARVRVIEIPIPSLRARGTDIVELAERFVDHYAHRAGREVPRISSAAAAALMRYDWPGNVRELQHVLERAVALSGGREVVPADFPSRILEDASRTALHPALDPRELHAHERRHIARLLAATDGSSHLALRIDRSNRPEPS